jgi:hypothetical protein
LLQDAAQVATLARPAAANSHFHACTKGPTGSGCLRKMTPQGWIGSSLQSGAEEFRVIGTDR